MPLQREKGLEEIIRELLLALIAATRPVDIALAAGAALQELDGLEEPR